MTGPAVRLVVGTGAQASRPAVRRRPGGAMIHPYASDQPEASRTPS
jgi:hypothetical protein